MPSLPFTTMRLCPRRICGVIFTGLGIPSSINIDHQATFIGPNFQRNFAQNSINIHFIPAKLNLFLPLLNREFHIVANEIDMRRVGYFLTYRFGHLLTLLFALDAIFAR